MQKLQELFCSMDAFDHPGVSVKGKMGGYQNIFAPRHLLKCLWSPGTPLHCASLREKLLI